MWTPSEISFFDSLPDFSPDHDAMAGEEFARLAKHRGWAIGGKTYRKNFRRCFGRDYVETCTSDADDEGVSLDIAFSRLALREGLKPTSKDYRNRRVAFYHERFEHHFGADATKLEIWQDLCEEVGIDPIPKSITQCKKALKSVHVNLVDLVNRRAARKAGRHLALVKFRNHWQLANYTINSGKIFPKGPAKRDGFLKILLREIF